MSNNSLKGIFGFVMFWNILYAMDVSGEKRKIWKQNVMPFFFEELAGSSFKKLIRTNLGQDF